MATKEEMDERALQEAYAKIGDDTIRNYSTQGIFRVAFLAGLESAETMGKLQLKIDDWQEKTFPHATALSKMSHLTKEIIELNKSLINRDGIGSELADCQHLLFGIASKCGLNLEEETRKKFEINKQRRWGKPDKNGVVEHIDSAKP